MSDLMGLQRIALDETFGGEAGSTSFLGYD